jgi:hypothetical protein
MPTKKRSLDEVIQKERGNGKDVVYVRLARQQQRLTVMKVMTHRK